MRQKEITIIYRSGEQETTYVDDCGVKNGCLWTYVRFGVNS